MTARWMRRLAAGLAMVAMIGGSLSAVRAQVGTANAPIDGDLASQPVAPAPATPPPPPPGGSVGPIGAPADAGNATTTSAYATGATPAAATGSAPVGTPDAKGGYQEDDLVGAAEGVFGKGAKGLALAIRDILKKQGQPIGYIVGREAGGAFVFGLRYGSGTLFHKIEGKRPVYWTGPSVGFDFGANGGNTFVLVYNVNDSDQLFTRFAAGEGQAYFVGGFHVSYLRHGDMVLIPVRLGVGFRLGVNGGYMKFTRKGTALPF